MAKKTSSSTPATMKVRGTNGKNRVYKKKACGTVASIKSQAKKVRANGGTARVKKRPGGGACLYVGPKSKNKKKTTTRRRRA
ncbi:MAG: hypothetical protein AAFU67_10450 [Bacteroidota bacterium]